MATFEDHLFVKNTKWIIWGVVALVLALLIFRAGMVVGFHQALRSHGLEHRPAAGPFGLPFPGGTIPGHGVVGSIATITLPTLTIRTRDGMDEKIDIASTTILHGDAGVPLSPSDLKVGDIAIVIGDPNDTDDMSEGEIDARLIRIVPPAGQNPLGGAPTTTMSNY